MATRELLRDKLAPAIGRVLLGTAFGPHASAIGGPVLDWLSVQLKSRDDARQAERFARVIANRMVDGLVPVFDRDHSPDLNPEAVAIALGETLDRHFDSRFLVAHDLDPKRLIEATFELRPLGDLKVQRYSTVDIALYERALPPLVEALIPQAKRFSDFEVANAAEVLKRLRELAREAGRTREGVDYLVKAQKVWERRRADAWREFEQDYANAILDRWNKLELFGIDVSADVQRKQKLSVAYIQLNLQSADAEDPSSGPGSLASFEEMLARAAETGQPLVILGEAGGGKTTVLRWAACEAVTRQLEDDALNPFTSRRGERFEAGWPERRLVEDQGKLAWWARVPLLLRLREVKDGGLPKEHDWPAKSAALSRDPPPDWLEEILGGGHGLILLDGLDELGSVGRDLARDTLRSILRDRRGNLVVLTSRPGALEPDWFEDVPLLLTTIRPMSPAQRQACITNWHEAVAQAKPRDTEAIHSLAKDLIRKLRTSFYLQEPTTNPLICAATCALHYGRQGYLPTGLVDLFEALCRMLVHERDQQQGLTEQAHVPEAYRLLDLSHKRQLLEDIAAEMVLNRASEWGRGDALVCVSERLAGIPAHRDADAGDVLKGLLLRSSLLRPSGDDAVDFLHNAFKEYLAAARFLTRRRYSALIDAADRDPGDRVFVYAYAIASARGEEDLTSELVAGLLDREAPDEAIGRRRQILGLRCRGVTVSAAGSILNRFDHLIDAVLPPRDAQEAEAIATLGDEVVERLRRPDEAPEIATACAHALVTIGTDPARRVLEPFKATEHEPVATELAFAFNPLELPYWQAKVRTRPERRLDKALPEAIASQVSDLAPLAGLTDVRELYLDGVAAVDLRPLAGFSGMRELSLNDTAVADLKPLARLADLQTLFLNNTAVADLKPLADLAGLQTLSLDNTRVADLTLLAGLAGLHTLSLANTTVADLTPLPGLAGLWALRLDNSTVADLTPLARLAGLKILFLNGTAVTDLTPLACLAGLETLSLDNSMVADLKPLADLASLQWLSLNNTAVIDLTPLAGLASLQWLSLDNTAVIDLTPLAGLASLQMLRLKNTAVADLTPVQHIEDLQIFGP